MKIHSKPADDDSSWSGNFITYFLVFTLIVVIGYLTLHNKNKLMAYLVEGRRQGGASGSRQHRPSHRHYEKLKNVNDAMDIDSSLSPTTTADVIIIKT